MERGCQPPQRDEALASFSLRTVVGTGWGAVLVVSLGVALLLILAGAGPRGNPDAAPWIGARRWFVVPGLAMCLAAVVARRRIQATSAEAVLGRLMWFSLGLVFVAMGFHARNPGHGALLLLLPGWALTLVAGTWVLLDRTNGRASKVGRILSFAEGFPGRAYAARKEARSTAGSTPPPGHQG